MRFWCDAVMEGGAAAAGGAERGMLASKRGSTSGGAAATSAAAAGGDSLLDRALDPLSGVAYDDPLEEELVRAFAEGMGFESAADAAVRSPHDVLFQ